MVTMNILITGGTGFIGAALVQALLQRGDRVCIFTRSKDHFESDNISYINNLSDIPESEYFECFINLAGENMAQGRWTVARKRELVDSRVGTTRALVQLARRLQRPPAVVVSASAIGFYGHQADERLAEQAEPVSGFSHRLCQAWEDEAAGFRSLGCRLCVMRLGVVFADRGGALEQITQSFRFGLGSWLGRGRQWLSWVHREDVIRALEFLLDTPSAQGVYNLTAPEPVTNRELCRELQGQLGAIICLPVPGFVLRLLLGEMADELLLNGQRVVPQRLQEAGFEFHYATLPEALANLVAR